MDNFYRGAVAVLLVLSAACESSVLTSPPITTPPPVIPLTEVEPPILAVFPAVTAPARVFDFDSKLDFPVRNSTKASRFVLYDSGSFALQISNIHSSNGTYTEAAGVITFSFGGGWSVAGSPDATGTIRGDTLTVQYNLRMTLSDFEDAVYLRAR